MKGFITFITFIAVANCNIIRFKPCSGKDKSTAEIISVDVSSCPKAPCQLKKGGTTSITIKFKPTYDISKLTTVVHGRVVFWVPFKLPEGEENACKVGGLKCPLKAGEDNTYTFSLLVSKSYPSLSVPISWELQDQDGKNAVCFMFPAKLVS